MKLFQEIDALYDVARHVCHDFGLPWTDPRTGVTYEPTEAQMKTQEGKAGALKALAARREANKTRVRIDNSALPAGSPMYYDCLACGDEIVVPEDWLTKSSLCPECDALKELGWLE